MRRFSALGCFFFLGLTSCSSQDVVTYSELREVNPNMKLVDVERITGHKGELIKNQNVPNALVATQPGQVVYYWRNKDGSSMSILFVNGRVGAITEDGLDRNK